MTTEEWVKYWSARFPKPTADKWVKANRALGIHVPAEGVSEMRHAEAAERLSVAVADPAKDQGV